MSNSLERYFEDENELRMMKVDFATFSGGRFPSPNALTDRWLLQLLVWWQYHGSSLPTLLGQPCSSSCVERNQSTYKFIHSLKSNKMASARIEDLVFMHHNFRLLSRRHEEYINATTNM